jgi:hypothetical protein
MFPHLNNFIAQAEMLKVNLFCPGRKKNYGYLERGNMGCKHMIFLPAKPEMDLSNYLHTIDYAAQFEYSKSPDDYPNNNWYSMIAFPHEYNKSYGKYGDHLQRGFCDMKQATENSQTELNNVFPKVAALAGYRKDKKVPKGWILYKDGTLLICSGNAAKAPDYKSKAPPGTAFHGEDQHDPQSPSDVLVQKKVKIQSLHQLFCVAEGLLRTLE